ncbi:MAG: hypothetical protein FJ267_11670 [Planctomycetes bacterium]|nr:hypothetical protein [Planctomycetota bacterium]
MEIKGSAERILDSVLPHEINHTILACLFRRPLPRWADEGAASLIEDSSERLRLRKIHEQAMGTNRKIPLHTLLDMKNYPSDRQQVLTMYAEGHSLADFLIQKSDKPSFLRFLSTAHQDGWPVALRQYGYNSIEAVEKEWDQWVMAGYPSLQIPEGSQLASTGNDDRRGSEDRIRGQEPLRNRSRLVLPILKMPGKTGAARISHDGDSSRQLPVTQPTQQAERGSSNSY